MLQGIRRRTDSISALPPVKRGKVGILAPAQSSLEKPKASFIVTNGLVNSERYTRKRQSVPPQKNNSDDHLAVEQP